MKTFKVLFAAGFLSFSSFAGAIPYNGAVTAGTAGSGRGSVEATDSPFLNPATLPFVRGYNFMSSYSASSSSTSEGASGTTDLSLSLLDNMKDTVVPTAISYVQGMVRPPDQSRIFSKDIRLAFGQRVSKRFSVGLAGHYKNDRTDFDSYNQGNLTLAGAVALTDNLALGVVGDDLLPAPKSVPEGFKLGTTTSFGLSHNHKRLIRTKLDLVSAPGNNFGKPTVSGGVETYMNKWLILRVGVARNLLKEANLFAGGLGFQGPKFGIHYAYQNAPEDQSLNRHSVDLAIPIW
jgi:hypothetical protein